MAKLSADRVSWLESTFGDRMTTRRVERKLYSHDIGEMPSLIKPLIGNPLTDAIVQPTSEDEIVALVKWAGAHGIPLIPRGKATSGYGGVLPVKYEGNAVLEDFSDCRKIKDFLFAHAMTDLLILWSMACPGARTKLHEIS